MTKFAGLDIGSNSIRLAVESDDETAVYGQELVFLELKDSYTSKLLLERYKSSFIRVGDTTYIAGNDASQLAAIFNLKTVTPSLDRSQNTASHAEELVAGVIATLVKRAQLGSGDKVVYSVAPEYATGYRDSGYLCAKIGAILTDLGLEAEDISVSQAIMYSELSDADYTGLAIDFGYTNTILTACYAAVPALAVTIPYGCGEVNRKVAATMAIGAERVSRHRKEAEFKGDELLGYTTYTKQYLDGVLARIKEVLETNPNLPNFDKPATVVLVGGALSDENIISYATQGIETLLESLGVKIKSVIVPDRESRVNSNVVGCLLAASTGKAKVVVPPTPTPGPPAVAEAPTANSDNPTDQS